MFGRLQDWFSPSTAEPVASDEERRLQAIALILVEAARADLDADESELRAIGRILRDEAGLSEAQADELLAAAGREHDRRVSLHETLDRINAEMNRPEKRRLMHWLWQVAYADGRLDPHEEARLRKLSELLHVPHEDFIRTKLDVAGSEA